VPPLKRRTLLAALAAGGAGLVALSRTGSCQSVAPGHSVLGHIPLNLHAAILSGTAKADLAPFFDAGAAEAVAAGQALYVPPGTYPMRTWAPPANLTVLTAGRQTVFQQLPTNGVPQRFIRILHDNVKLWPAGSATIKGEIARNATTFNSGVQVYAGEGATISSFVCGDVFGVDLGGDVLETGSHPLGKLGRCQIGTIYGDNILRNIVSITAGSTGRIEGVVQLGGVGLLGLDFEPDANSGSPIENWTFGKVRCHRVTFAGDPARPIGNISGDSLDLSYTDFGSSRPPFNYAGVNASANPTLFEVGLRYRNCSSVTIKRAVIRNFPRGAIIDIGEGDDDSYTGLFRIDYLELHNDGAKSTYEIAQQKTRRLSIGYLMSRDKPNPSTASLIGGTAQDSLAEIDDGEISGRLVAQHTGRVRLRGKPVS
jgi:hypothetical protein